MWFEIMQTITHTETIVSVTEEEVKEEKKKQQKCYFPWSVSRPGVEEEMENSVAYLEY